MPSGLMGTTATPPIASPAGRPAGRGGGLFGGSPYPVDPSMQQGLTQDAWRQFGLALMASAQNPNLSQGLAGALQAGRQAYGQGAEQAYQVGREQEQDKQYQEYRQAQVKAQEALAEQRRQDAERERRESGEAAESAQQQAERVQNVLAELERSDPDRARGLRQIIALSGGKIPASALGELMPQEEAAMTPYQQEQVRLSEERLNLQRQRGAGGGAKPSSLPPWEDPAYIAKRVAYYTEEVGPERAPGVVAQELDILRQSVADQGLQAGMDRVQPPPVGGSSPARREQPETGGVQADPETLEKATRIEAIVNQNPQLLKGVQTMIDRNASPDEILKRLEDLGFGG